MVPKKSPQKPRLTSAEVAALARLHQVNLLPVTERIPAGLCTKRLVCYAEGWRLTKLGKDMARHLTGVR